MESGYGLILSAVIGLGGLGVLFAVGLAVANAKLAVKQNPLAAEILELLPGANCGACGYAGCAAYADAVAEGGVDASLCIPGGGEVAGKVAALIGSEVEAQDARIAVVHCNRTGVETKVEYAGLSDCKAATMFADNLYKCAYACIGLGSCAKACPFGAIVMDERGIPVIIEGKCTGCGVCAGVCPKGIISVEKDKSLVHIRCRSHDKGGVARKTCERACIGCMKCAKECPVDAIEIKDFLACIDYDKCVSCGKCVAVCPTGAIGNFRQMRRRKSDAA